MIKRLISLFDYLNQSFVKQNPIYLILYVTARCNAKCRMCFYWENIGQANKSKELSIDEIKKISSKMGKFIQLSIGGGEPSLREDLAEICEIFSRQNKVRYITLPSNGIDTKRVVSAVSRIKQLCPDTHLRVSLSLDGPEKIHDYIRGVSCYTLVIETFTRLIKLKSQYSGLTVDFATVLQKENQSCLKDWFKIVQKEYSPDNHMLMLARGDMREEGCRDISYDIYKDIIAFRRERYNKQENRRFSSLFRALNLRSDEVVMNEYFNHQFKIPCVAGKRLVVIDEYGGVKPCEILKDKIGDLRENHYDLNRLLQSKRAKEIQQKIKEKKCHCTFECAVNISVLYDWRRYPDLFFKALREAGKVRK